MAINNRPRVLYAIQGTGNGHISRACEIIPLLRQMADVDILISGSDVEIKPEWPVKYRLNGYGFYFGTNGGIDFSKTFAKSSMWRLLQEVSNLPVEDYDFVINDFEPVSAWACKIKGVPCIGMSHQAAVIPSHSPKPRLEDPFGSAIINNYAPTHFDFGFHFERYSPYIFTPVIRQSIRLVEPANHGHCTVYLPAYDTERILEMVNSVGLRHFKWHIFSKKAVQPANIGNATVFPINADRFVQSLSHADSVLCGAGFETPAEALFLNKKLLVVPMKNQYEQQCNAAALKKMGVPVIKNIKPNKWPLVYKWLLDGTAVKVEYANETAAILKLVIEKGIELQTSKLPRIPDALLNPQSIIHKVSNIIHSN